MASLISKRVFCYTASKTLFLHRSFSGTARCCEKIGFIGLGNMGAHMARNLMNKGKHSLVVFDASPAAYKQVKDCEVVESPADVAAACKYVVTMLPASSHVRNVYIGENGLLSKVQPDSLLIDSSTIDPAVSQSIAAQFVAKKAIYVDAPVSGGTAAARDALLTFMVGSPNSEKFEEAKKLLSLMGKNVFHCGDVGMGQAVKICNNMLLAVSMIGTAETMNLGMSLGVDPKLLASVLNVSSGRCWSSELYNPVPGVKEGTPACNDYQGGFMTKLMSKDLGLAQTAATAVRAPTVIGSVAHNIYRLMCNSGFGDKDFSSIFQFIQENAKNERLQ